MTIINSTNDLTLPTAQKRLRDGAIAFSSGAFGGLVSFVQLFLVFPFKDGKGFPGFAHA